MSIKYIYILGLISILETRIESKIEIQSRKNVLSSRSPASSQGINIKLPEENKRVIHVHKPHKNIAIHKPSKLTNKHHKPSMELPVYIKGPKFERQHKISSEVYPIYLHQPKVDEKRLESSNSSPKYVKSPKIKSKHLKSSKRSPIHGKSSKIDKKHQKSSKGSPKEHVHSSKSSKIDKKHHQPMDTPSIYLKPPEIGQKSKYRTHKHRRPSKKVIPKKKLRKPSNSATDYLNGEENRQEKYQHYVRDHEPVRQASEESNNDDGDPQKEESQEEENFLDSDKRVDFHIHGHDGPESYVFGFDTGKGDNRQFRWEQRHENGTVTGQYGYYDPRGKFKKILYRSDPFFGYQQSVVDEENDARNLINNENE